MQPEKRIPIVRRIVTRLDAEEDWSEIDFVLDQFGFATENEWYGSKRAYIRHVLVDNGDDAKIEALDRYLTGHANPVGEEPWDEDNGPFRLFITHIAKKKLFAHELKGELVFFGVDAFVAHEDIEPGKEWQRVIESALRSCHALTALLHTGIKESNWCDQEVGMAHSRGVPVVPVRLELDPYGFLGSVQAICGVGLEPTELVLKLVLLLLRDKRTGEALTEAIVDRLIHARSFDQANRLAKLLMDESAHLTNVHMRALRKAQKENSQVEHAWNVDWAFTQMEKKLGIVASKSSEPEVSSGPFLDFDEEPF